MAANTKEFPMMDMSISGTLRTQIMIAMVSEEAPLSLFPKSSFFDAFIIMDV